MSGRLPEGRVVLYDDDHYYMGAVVAEKLARAGAAVTFVTPGDKVSAWSGYTAEQTRTQRRLIELGVGILPAHGLEAYDGCELKLACVYTGRERRVSADALILVTARRPNDALYRALADHVAAGAAGAPRTLQRIGDCEAPAIIAAAIYAGHRYARFLDEEAGTAGSAPALRDRVVPT